MGIGERAECVAQRAGGELVDGQLVDAERGGLGDECCDRGQVAAVGRGRVRAVLLHAPGSEELLGSVGEFHHGDEAGSLSVELAGGAPKCAAYGQLCSIHA